MKKLIVKGLKVLIQPDEAPDVSKGGIIIPDAAKPIAHAGVIIGVGEDVRQYEVGDKVLFLPHAGTDITYEGKKYKIYSEESILAEIIEE